MLRQSIFGRLAGYEDVNDALRLRHDPAMRWIIGRKATKHSGASPSQMGRFETNWLAIPENLTTLADLSGHWIDQVAAESRKSGRNHPAIALLERSYGEYFQTCLQANSLRRIQIKIVT